MHLPLQSRFKAFCGSIQPPAYKKINSVDPDQTAPLGSVRPGSTLPKTRRKSIFFLRVKEYLISVLIFQDAKNNV